MPFWSSRTLESRLPGLIEPYAVERIDCNAYTLRIGDEFYVSPNDQTSDPESQSIRKLRADEAFTVPPGQFAFLVTEERVSVPTNAMAFISMKAKIKFRGLVNVSGFHVDPGFCGRLIFSVFNAGPAVIHLRRGQDCFLIWFASLDGESQSRSGRPSIDRIPTEAISGISGELQSLAGLQRKITELDRTLSEKIRKLEPEHAALVTRVTIFVAIVIAILAYIVRDAMTSGRSIDASHLTQPVDLSGRQEPSKSSPQMSTTEKTLEQSKPERPRVASLQLAAPSSAARDSGK